MTKPTAFLYARFSTSRQQFSDSLRRQTEAAKEYCDRHGYELSDTTFEDLGVSGFKSGRSRPALEEFIAAVEQGKIPRGSILLCEDHDRLGRLGWVYTMNLIHRLVGELGITIVMTKSGKVYDASNVHSVSDNIQLMFSAERSWEESQRKSDLIRAQRSQVRRNRDVCGKLPFWIKRAENGSQFEFDTLKLDAVKRLVELRLQGKSMQGVAKTLNSEGYVTGAGSAWSGSGVRSIVQNAALYGAKEYFDSDITTGRMNSKPIDVALNVFPKLIEYETWQAMQQKSSGGQGGRVTRKGAYSNLLKCGLCGGAMTQRTSKYKGDLRVYRVCLKGGTEGSCERIERIREPEKYLDLALRGLTYQVRESSYVSKTPELQAQLRTLEETTDILINAGLAEKLAELYKKIIAVKESIDESTKLDQQQSDPVVRSFNYVMDIQDVSERNVMLRQLLDRIEFHLLWKEKTHSMWRIDVYQSNGLKHVFTLDQRHGFGNSSIQLIASGDAVKQADAKHELEPWEIDQD